jgi:hypothetical protein
MGAPEDFARTYVENGGNGVEAYRVSHPSARQMSLSAIAFEIRRLLVDPHVIAYMAALKEAAAARSRAPTTQRSPQASPPRGPVPSGKKTRHYRHVHCGVVSHIDELKHEAFERTQWPTALWCSWCGHSVSLGQLELVEEHVLE